jgi:hypothetical protein
MIDMAALWTGGAELIDLCQLMTCRFTGGSGNFWA